MTTLDELTEQTENTEDILFLTLEETKKIYKSEISAEIIDKLANEEIRSMRHLSRRIDRDKNNVRTQIKKLVELDIVTLEDSKFKGAGCKRPELKHDAIIPKPAIRR